MSSATPSHPTSLTTDGKRAVAAWIDRLVSGIKAAAFWGAAVLPLVVIAGLAVGTIGQSPAILAVVLGLNAVCAVVGHGHTPGR